MILKFTSTIHEIRRNLTILGEPKETIDSLSVCRKQRASVVFFLHLHLNKRHPDQTIESNCPLARNQSFLASSKKTTGRVVPTPLLFPPIPPLFPESDETTTKEGEEYTDGGARRGADFRPGEKNVIQFKNHSLSARASLFLPPSSFFSSQTRENSDDALLPLVHLPRGEL